MPDVSFVQASFLGGEWSPFIQGRVDQQSYKTGLNRCLNYIPLDEGSLVRRPGLLFSSYTKDPSSNTRVLPLQVSDTNNYLIEVTNNLFRFYTGGAIIRETEQTVSSIDNDSPASVHVDAHGYSTGDWVIFTPSAGDTAYEVRNRIFEVTKLDNDNFSLSHTGLFSGPFDGATLKGWNGGTVSRIHELAAPYASADLADLKYAQDESGVYIFHENYQPRRLSFGDTSLTDFSLATLTFKDGPYMDTNGTATTFTPSGTSGSITITANSVTGINNGLGFQTTDIGRLIRFQDANGNWTWMTITARTSTTVVTATVNGGNIASTVPRTTWKLGVYSDTTGWPSCGAFHADRLWVAGGGAFPNRIEGSVSGSDTSTQLDFTPTAADGTVSDANGCNFKFVAETSSRINWIMTDVIGLVCGTLSGEWLVRASATDEPITPTSIDARRVTKYKAASIMPVKAQDAILFVQAEKRRVMEYSYSTYNSRYIGSNISKTGKHLTVTGLKEMAYQTEPLPVVWAIREDGVLIGCSYYRGVRDILTTSEDSYAAWHQHTFDYNMDTKPVCQSIAAMPSDTGLTDDLWVAVKRTINGVDIVSIERTSPLFDNETSIEDGYFLGDGVQLKAADYNNLWVWNNDGTFTMYGLWHIEGVTVDVTFRGADLGSFTVADGRITVSVPDELLSASSAGLATDPTQIDQKFSSVTVTPNGQYLSDLYESDLPHGPGTGPGYYINFMYGEDNVAYNMSTSNTTFCLTRVTDSVIVDTFDETRFAADAVANGVDGGYTFNQANMVFVPVINTPYFVFIDHVGFGPHANQTHYCCMLYKINSAGAIEGPLGGFLECSGDGTIFGTVAPNSQDDIRGMGQWGEQTLDDPILFASFTNRAADIHPGIFKLPSVNQFIATGFDISLAENTSGDGTDPFGSRLTDLKAVLGSSYLTTGLTSYRDTTQRNLFSFLPYYDAAWQTIAVTYVGKAETQYALDHPGTAQSHVLAMASAYPNGYLEGYLLTEIPNSHQFSVTRKVLNDVILDREGNSIMPFPDVGLDKDGVTTNLECDYWQPQVQKTDFDFPAPWVMMFPHSYGGTVNTSPDGCYVASRFFQWSPYDKKAVEIADQVFGEYFTAADIGKSGTVQDNHSNFAAFWDKTTNKILMGGYFVGISNAAHTRVIFGEFADFGTLDLQQFDLTTVSIGFSYSSEGQLLRPEEGGGNGPAFGKIRRLDNASVLFYRSGNIEFGTGFDKMYPAQLRALRESQAVTPLYSGMYQLNVEDSLTYDGELAWRQTRPVPGNIIAVAGFLNTRDQ